MGRSYRWPRSGARVFVQELEARTRTCGGASIHARSLNTKPSELLPARRRHSLEMRFIPDMPLPAVPNSRLRLPGLFQIWERRVR